MKNCVKPQKDFGSFHLFECCRLKWDEDWVQKWRRNCSVSSSRTLILNGHTINWWNWNRGSKLHKQNGIASDLIDSQVNSSRRNHKVNALHTARNSLNGNWKSRLNRKIVMKNGKRTKLLVKHQQWTALKDFGARSGTKINHDSWKKTAWRQWKHY